MLRPDIFFELTIKLKQ